MGIEGTYDVDATRQNLEAALNEILKGHFLSQVLFELHEELSPRIEAFVRRLPTPERIMAAQSVAQVVLACKAVDSLSHARQHTIAYANLRAVEEAASNLFYALYAGPIVEGRSAQDLAEQFLAYRDWDHRRAVNKSRVSYREKFRTGWVPEDGSMPNNLSDFETFCDGVVVRGDATRARYPKMGDGSWHSTNKEARTEKVLIHMPSFVNSIGATSWKSVHESNFLFNTILHGGPMMFEQDLARVPPGQLLALKNDAQDDLNWSVLAAHLGRICWDALGEQCGELPLVQETWRRLYATHLARIKSEQHMDIKLRWPNNSVSVMSGLLRRRA